MKKSNKQTAAVTELKNKIILVTGGAGSVGTALTKKLLEFPIKQIRVIDIDEHALFKLKRECDDKRLRLLLGNILDKERIDMASKNIDILIHTAAIKNIEISEFNPIETIETNVDGVVNLIKMCMAQKPKKFLNVSTDKVVESSTLYGVTKLLGEKITTWAGIHLNPPTKFASVRFGNVIETRGNVFEIWAKEKSNNLPLSITHEEMERYFFHINEAVDFIINSIPLINTGETFIPKMKKMKMKELLKDYSSQYKVIGLRKGEKLSEELMTREERKNAIEKKNMWIIKPKN